MGEFILHSAVDEFEAKLASYLRVKHAIGLSDCTNAMLLGLRASGVQRGDEIIIPSHAFVAAAQSIHFAGAVPVPVDLDEHDGCLVDPASVRRAITPRTRGIMAVHVNGRDVPTWTSSTTIATSMGWRSSKTPRRRLARPWTVSQPEVWPLGGVQLLSLEDARLLRRCGRAGYRRR